MIAIVFTGLFAIDHSRLHALLTALAALVMVLNLYLVSLFGYPFQGDLRVSDLPFRVDIGLFDGIYDDDGDRTGHADLR